MDFYSQHLPLDQQTKKQDCLSMIHFGMTSTYLTFLDQYYEYDGGQEARTLMRKPSQLVDMNLPGSQI